jgi:hypothetical protein
VRHSRRGKLDGALSSSEAAHRFPERACKRHATGSDAWFIAEVCIIRMRSLITSSVPLSAAQDGTVVAWAEKPDGSWARTLVHDFGAPVWRVSWSVTGDGSQGLLTASSRSSLGASFGCQMLVHLCGSLLSFVTKAAGLCSSAVTSVGGQQHIVGCLSVS